MFDQHLPPPVQHEAVERRLVLVLGDRSAHFARAASAPCEYLDGIAGCILEQKPAGSVSVMANARGKVGVGAPSASLGEGTLVGLCYADMVEPVERHCAVSGGIHDLLPRGRAVRSSCAGAWRRSRGNGCAGGDVVQGCRPLDQGSPSAAQGRESERLRVPSSLLIADGVVQGVRRCCGGPLTLLGGAQTTRRLSLAALRNAPGTHGEGWWTG